MNELEKNAEVSKAAETSCYAVKQREKVEDLSHLKSRLARNRIAHIMQFLAESLMECRKGARVLTDQTIINREHDLKLLRKLGA